MVSASRDNSSASLVATGTICYEYLEDGLPTDCSGTVDCRIINPDIPVLTAVHLDSQRNPAIQLRMTAPRVHKYFRELSFD